MMINHMREMRKALNGDLRKANGDDALEGNLRSMRKAQHDRDAWRAYGEAAHMAHAWSANALPSTVGDHDGASHAEMVRIHKNAVRGSDVIDILHRQAAHLHGEAHRLHTVALTATRHAVHVARPLVKAYDPGTLGKTSGGKTITSDHAAYTGKRTTTSPPLVGEIRQPGWDHHDHFGAGHAHERAMRSSMEHGQAGEAQYHQRKAMLHVAEGKKLFDKHIQQPVPRKLTQPHDFDRLVHHVGGLLGF